MKKTIVVCGHGPGISHAVAQRFAREGFAVALVARNAERIAKAATELGGDTRSFACDLGSTDAVKSMLRDVRAQLGPIAVVHWNAYASVAGDLLTADVAELRSGLDLSVLGLVAAVQEALPDLKAQKGSVLVTGGGLGFHDVGVAKMAVDWSAMGLGVQKAAQHKTTALLQQRLLREEVYVGEVVVLGMVKGTAFDGGNATLEPKDIADKFWDLHDQRVEHTVNFGG